jgi:hypothetical protein
MSGVDFSNYSRRHFIAVIVHNLDRHTLYGPPG